MDVHVGVGCDHSRSAWFVRPDCDIGVHLDPRFKMGFEPLLERLDLELPGAPAGTRRG